MHVVSRSIHGVDVNPRAVELCKVSLWMEALEPGRPLSFLDHRIQVGNSLLGATPALLARGVEPVLEPVEGDLPDDGVQAVIAPGQLHQEVGAGRLGLAEEPLDDAAALGAEVDREPIYVPFALPGEIVEFTLRYDNVGEQLVGNVTQPTLVLNAIGAYGPEGFPPLVGAENAQATANAFPNARSEVVPFGYL